MDEVRIDQVERKESFRRSKPKFILKIPKQETKGKEGFISGTCNYIVHDNTTQYFYSRVNGTGNCEQPKYSHPIHSV
jgi:hypothetical protein